MVVEYMYVYSYDKLKKLRTEQVHISTYIIYIYKFTIPEKEISKENLL